MEVNQQGTGGQPGSARVESLEARRARLRKDRTEKGEATGNTARLEEVQKGKEMTEREKELLAVEQHDHTHWTREDERGV